MHAEPTATGHRRDTLNPKALAGLAEGRTTLDTRREAIDYALARGTTA